MSTATAPQSTLSRDLGILACTFVTATVHTASGNSYVVVARNGLTTLIATCGPYAGTPITGDRLTVDGMGRLVLTDEGRFRLQSTMVVNVDVHEN